MTPNPTKLLALLPPDKALHVIGGALIYVWSFSSICIFHWILTDRGFSNADRAHYIAVGFGLAAAIVNEVIQRWRNRSAGTRHGIEPLDALATAAGTLVAAAPMQLVLWVGLI